MEPPRLNLSKMLLWFHSLNGGVLHTHYYSRLRTGLPPFPELDFSEAAIQAWYPLLSERNGYHRAKAKESLKINMCNLNNLYPSSIPPDIFHHDGTWEF